MTPVNDAQAVWSKVAQGLIDDEAAVWLAEFARCSLDGMSHWPTAAGGERNAHSYLSKVAGGKLDAETAAWLADFAKSMILADTSGGDTLSAMEFADQCAVRDWRQPPRTDPAKLDAPATVAEKRKELARGLMRRVAARIESPVPLSPTLSDWLVESLFEAADKGQADVAFGLKSGRGGRARSRLPILRLQRAAVAHALMAWLGLKQTQAAELMADLANGLDRSDATAIAKSVTQVDADWQIVQPLSGADLDLFMSGAEVSVRLEHRQPAQGACVLALPAALRTVLTNERRTRK